MNKEIILTVYCTKYIAFILVGCKLEDPYTGLYSVCFVIPKIPFLLYNQPCSPSLKYLQ